MEVEKGSIFSILNHNRQFKIPLYQRYYSWDQEHCERLWNDIVFMQEFKKDCHFVGSIVVISEKTTLSHVEKYLIIDGQQRLTTLSLLMIALRDYLEENERDSKVYPGSIEKDLLFNDNEDKEDRYKLKLNEFDDDVFVQLVEKRSVDKNTNSLIWANYKFFKEKVASRVLTPASIIDAIGKLQIVNIILDRQLDDAQGIFASLNSTGKDLSQTDLIRNYLLMKQERKEQEDIYNSYWKPMENLFENQDSQEMDQFFHQYLILKTNRFSKMERDYSSLKRFHEISEFSTKELAADIYKFARYYAEIAFGRHENKVIKDLCIDIKELKMSVAMPFLMRVWDDLNENIINEDDVIEILQLCISYVFRRSICAISASSLNHTFRALVNDINVDDYVRSIQASLVLAENTKVFPDDERFVNSFVTRNIYHMRSNMYLFRKLENFNNKTSITMDNYTIEHIMPQNVNLSNDWKEMLGPNYKDVQKTYLHTIGNLTLTTYNSEMSDSSFLNKMEMTGGYKQSQLRLNSSLIDQTCWNEKRIVDRANELAKKALKVWIFPKLSEEELAPYVKVKGKVSSHTLEEYKWNDDIHAVFSNLNAKILERFPKIKINPQGEYIAYQIDSQFLRIYPHVNYFMIGFISSVQDFKDPKKILEAKEIHKTWGKCRTKVKSMDQIDYLMELISQAYNLKFNSKL